MTVHTAGIPSIVAINLAPAAADTGNPAGSVVVVERAIQRPGPSQRVGRFYRKRRLRPTISLSTGSTNWSTNCKTACVTTAVRKLVPHGALAPPCAGHSRSAGHGTAGFGGRSLVANLWWQISLENLVWQISFRHCGRSIIRSAASPATPMGGKSMGKIVPGPDA